MTLLWALLLGALGPAVARAQAGDEELLRQGIQLRKRGQNAEALVAFQRAYELRPSARAQAQVALAEQALGHWTRAELGLTAVLSGPRNPWIERYRRPLERALETVRDHLGTLEIEANVGGALILIGGEAVGHAPLPRPLRVVAGLTRIEVQAQGYPSVTREVEVPARGVVTAAIVVVPNAPSPSATEASGPESGTQADGSLAHAAQASEPGARAAQQRDGPEAHMQAHGEPAARSRRSGGEAETTSAGSWPAIMRRTGWVTLAAAGPLLATGVAAHWVRQRKVGAYNDDARCFFGEQTRDQRCGGDRRATHRAQAVAITGYAAGGVALGTALALLLWTRANDEHSPWSLTPTLGPHATILTWRTSF